MTGTLFGADVSATDMFAVKRHTAKVRAEGVAALIAADPQAWIIWCDSNDEEDALRAAIPSAVAVRGSMTPEQKEAGIAGFLDGSHPWLVSKSSIMGMGLNMQHCRRMAFVGRSFSYEAWYQAVRRCWRFGQTEPVDVHIMVAEGEDQIGRVIDRKAEGHAEMKAAMRAATKRNMEATSAVKVPYEPKHEGRLPTWLISSAA